MRKLLPIAFLVTIVACKKKDDSITRIGYKGKWYVQETISKQYYIEDNGDTNYYRNEQTVYGDSLSYIDFMVESGQSTGKAVIQLGMVRDSANYIYETREYFRLDSALCKVSVQNDSVFHFNTIAYDGAVIPDKVLVQEDYFILSK
jgi:hypothetical protein